MDALRTTGLVAIAARSEDEDYYAAIYRKDEIVEMINKFLFEVKGKNNYQYIELNKILRLIARREC